MKQQCLFTFSLILLFLHFTKTLAQQSPAAAPAQPPPAPPTTPPPQPPAAQVTTKSVPRDIVKVLDKAGHFSLFIRLLKSTQEETELFNELNTTTNGFTVLAPSDGAFSGLKVGTLNTLTDDQKTELVKFHIIPGFVALSQFETLSNPVRTRAGTGDRVGLNVTTERNSVNISTGITNATLSGTIYSDNQLAVYQVDKVLLPMDLFSSKPQAPAPAPALALAPQKAPPPMKEAPVVDAPALPKDISAAVNSVVYYNVEPFLAVFVVSAMFGWF